MLKTPSETYIEMNMPGGVTDFSVEGIVEHGRGMGHKYLLPTTNLIPPVEMSHDPTAYQHSRQICSMHGIYTQSPQKQPEPQII